MTRPPPRRDRPRSVIRAPTRRGLPACAGRARPRRRRRQAGRSPPSGEWLAGAIGFLSDQQLVPPPSESERIMALLADKQLIGDTQAWLSLVDRYGGNGLAF